MSGLARADWPVLSHLHLSQNDLDAAAMHHVCKIRLPALQKLVLEQASITPEGAYWLAQGSWPLLTSMDLSHNKLNAKAIQHITNGKWPQLLSLELTENPFGSQGLQYLTNGQWPVLESLAIGLHALTSDSILLLGLDADKVQELLRLVTSGGSCYCSEYVHRAVSQSGMSLWPKLKVVLVQPAYVW